MYAKTEVATLAFDCGAFHGNCAGVTPVWIGYPALYCPTCRVIGHVDLVASHIDHVQCCKPRTEVG